MQNPESGHSQPVILGGKFGLNEALNCLVCSKPQLVIQHSWTVHLYASSNTSKVSICSGSLSNVQNSWFYSLFTVLTSTKNNKQSDQLTSVSLNTEAKSGHNSWRRATWPEPWICAETPQWLLLPPGLCCSRSSEPSDKGVYLIHILINMEPHFLPLRALGDNIIHRALSRAERLLFTQPTILFHVQPPLLLLLSNPLPVTSCLFRHNKTTWKMGRKDQRWRQGCIFLYAETNNVVWMHRR